MYKILVFVLVVLTSNVQAQYYYNDILGNIQAKDNFLLFKKNNIKKVSVTTTNPDNEPAEGFAILQQVNGSKNEMTTSTTSEMSPTSILKTNYLPNGYPESTKDSTEASVSLTFYTYQDPASQHLRDIASSTHEPGSQVTKFFEARKYLYNGAVPKMMMRVKNGKDSLKVLFIAEEHGWVGEERWIQKGMVVESYYYYYDTGGHLTDIARFNLIAQKTLPEYTFEYDERGRMTGMNAFVSGTSQYRTWRYTYDERGLKTSEVIFNKFKKMEGKVLYSYQ